MRTVYLVEQFVSFLLLAGGVMWFVYRTGRFKTGIALAWAGLVALFTVWAMIGHYYALGRGSVQLSPNVAGPAEDELANAFPDGQHVFAMILFGWFYGVAICALASWCRERWQDNDSLNTEH